MFEPVETGLNNDGEVAVFLGESPGLIEGWYPEAGSGIWLRISGRIDRPLALSREALDAACGTGRVLIVVVGNGRVVDERWVDRDVEPATA